MNKPSPMAGGLPAKPYVPPAGPTPPLPAGPPPPQPGYNQAQQDPAAAHAAAWAAYYQSQGLTATGQPQPATNYNANQPQLPPAANTSNPYANYGYGAQAAQAHLGQGGPSQRGNQSQQQSYRPPPQQNYAYQPQPQQGYQSPTPYQAAPQAAYGGGGPPQPGAYGPAQPQQWNQPGPQPYRPPQAGPAQGYNGAGPQQPFYNNVGPQQQPYTPPHTGAQTPYRPPASNSPAPMSQNRPYRPQPQPTPQRPPRPPMNQGPTPPHHPPAKRPRFDGPGAPPGPSSGGPPARPNLPVRPGSMPARPPSGPRAPLPAPPIMRPPIHLGTGSAPPVFAPGGPRGASGPMRGMGGDRGRGRGGMIVNAPRGPSHMRRERNHDSHHQGHHQRDRDRSRRVDASPSKRDRKDGVNSSSRKKDNVKTTMTDFRIVGIEIKELGWTWGLVGEEAMEQVPEEKESKGKPSIEVEKQVKTEVDTALSTPEVNAGTTPVPPAETEASSSDVKDEPVETAVKEEASVDSAQPEATPPAAPAAPDTVSETIKDETTVTDDAEGKVGAKRKAQSPEAEEGSFKERSTYLLTHGKANEAPSHESNQNRFRIYFESPPEADRIPQALRRNPYKRWRRASSSVAPSRQGDDGEREKGKDQDKGEKAAKEKDEPVVKLPEVAEEGEGAAPADISNIPEPSQTTVEPVDNSTTEVPESVSAEPAVDTAPAATEGDEGITIEQAGEVEVAQPEQATPDIEQSAPADQVALGTAAPEAVIPAEDALAADPNSEVEETALDATPDVPEVSLDSKGEEGAEAAVQPEAAEPTADGEAQGEAAATEQANGSTTEGTPAPEPATASTDPATSAELSAALAQSAENAASAYKSRTRRRSSVSSTDSRDTIHAFQPEVTPSTNRLSILYEGSQRRMCFDAEVVDKIRVYREEGRIEVLFKPQREEKDDEESGDSDTLLPKGFLLETYDQDEQRFAPVYREKLEELYSADDVTDSIPPLHRQLGCPTPPVEPLSINVYLNKKNPLSLPRWCRTNSADEWLYEQFGSKSISSAQDGWRGKLEVMDPDPPPTLANILETWSTSSSIGSLTKRTEFTSSLLSEPYDLLEILLRLTRGDRNPTASTSAGSGSGGSAGVSLTAAMRADSPYASHQTHVSLAILAMYRLTTDYAAKAGEKSEVVNEKIGDIIKSLPSGMISRSLDGMFKEWDGKGKDRDRK